jgi:hypothetical protein
MLNTRWIPVGMVWLIATQLIGCPTSNGRAVEAPRPATVCLHRSGAVSRRRVLQDVEGGCMLLHFQEGSRREPRGVTCTYTGEDWIEGDLTLYYFNMPCMGLSTQVGEVDSEYPDGASGWVTVDAMEGQAWLRASIDAPLPSGQTVQVRIDGLDVMNPNEGAPACTFLPASL